MRYRYVKATPQHPSPGRIIPRYLKIIPTIVSAIGLSVVASVVWPMVSYQVAYFFQQSNTSGLLSPAIYESFANEENAVEQPKVLADIDYTKASNWFSFSPLEASQTDGRLGAYSNAPTPAAADSSYISLDGASLVNHPDINKAEYEITIPTLGIKGAKVKVNEDDLTKSLVQYKGTSLPGESGSPVIFGHSTLPQFFSATNYLAIFSTLPTIKVGADILVDYAGIEYTYRIVNMYEVNPSDIWVLRQNYNQKSLKLITCVPPGTKLRRLVVEANLVKS